MLNPGTSTDWSVYLVTDPSYVEPSELPATVRTAIEGGVTVVQLRDKHATEEAFRAQATALRAAMPDDVPLFVNDRVEIAQELGLHLHIGQSDMPYVDARRLLSAQQMIGLSIENEHQLDTLLRECLEAGVKLPDVIGLGPVLETATKPDAADPVGVDGVAVLAKKARQHGIASVAIGGVSLANARALSETDIDGLCVVSAIMGAENPAAAASELARAFRPPTIPRVLSIAGTDPSGGAGAQADIKAISAAGGYAMSVITALVAQNTQGVRDICIPDTQFLRQQLDSVSDDICIDAIKIGMLGSAEVITTVEQWLSAFLRRNPDCPVVIDPVMVATSGDRLLTSEAEEKLNQLLNYATVITPNSPELAVIAGEDEPTTWEDSVEMATRVAAQHGVAVIVKAGHLPSEDVGNAVVTADGLIAMYTTPRINTANTHGTGCSLSSALATRLAKRDPLPAALEWTTQWLYEAIEFGHVQEVGNGHGPVDHFHRLRRLATAGNTTPLPFHSASTGSLLPACATRITPAIAPAGPWTAQLWASSADVFSAILNLPFIKRLAAGTLSVGEFTFYQAQDALYLKEYSRALATLSAKAPLSADQVAWAKNAQGCIAVESQLHEQWLGEDYPRTGPSGVTQSYTDYLAARTSLDEYAVGVAAVLPCFWLYSEIGIRLSNANHEDHPYRAWLDTYSDDEFLASTREAVSRLERALESASGTTRRRAARAYLQACYHELWFFDQATRTYDM